MDAIQFHVPAVPVAQPRPRAAKVAGAVRIYEPSKHPVVEYKSAVRYAAHSTYWGMPFSGAVRAKLVFVFPRPTSKLWKKKPTPRYPHTIKPDVDNLTKSTLDALSGICFRDDKQVCECSVEKWVAAGDEQPHVEVTIWPLES